MPFMSEIQMEAQLKGAKAETFRLPGGREFLAVFNNPHVEGNELQGNNPSAMAIESQVSALRLGDIVTRKSPVERYEFRTADTYGNGTFTVLNLRFKT